MTSYVRDFWTYTAHQRPTVGDVKMSVITTDHMGWLLCDGRELSKSDYNILYQIIGDAYGASSTTFNLPRAAGRVLGNVNTPSVSGYDLSRNTWNLGDVSGEETHTLTIAQMPSHNHGVAAGGQTAGNNLTDVSGLHNHGGQTSGLLGGSNIVNATEPVYNGLTPLNAIVNAGEGTHDHAISPDGVHAHRMNPAGGDQPHNNIQPTLIIGNTFMYCGKPRQGTYPTSPVNYFYY